MKELNLIQKEQKSLNVSVMLDTKGFFEKPKVNMVGSISNRISGNQVDLKVEELAKEITLPDAKTWMPAIMKGKRLNENWKSQQVVALDFDGGYPFEEALKRLEEYGLSCTFAYNTFSAKQKEKYRMVFVLDELVTESKMMQAIINNFKLLFPESDQGASDLARMFYGGKEVIFDNYEYQFPLDLIEISTTAFQVSDCKNDRAISRKLGELSKKRNPISIYNRKEKKRHIDHVRKFNWNMARENCFILDDFFNGEWITHPQLFGIATNIHWIEGGLKLMKKVMESVGKYSKNNFNILPSVRKYKYMPMHLQNFSPHEEDYVYCNILDAGKLDKGVIIRKEKYVGKSQEQISKEINSYFADIVSDSTNDISIICAPTGTGKTEKYLSCNNVTIAAPTHKLKEEIKHRFKDKGMLVTITPEIPHFADKEINNHINYLYKVGAKSEVHNYLVDISNQKDGNYVISGDSQMACEYLANMNMAMQADNVLITTHHRTNSLKKHSIVIFDEDPLRSFLLPIERLKIGDLYKLKNKTRNIFDSAMINGLIQNISKAEMSTVYEMPDMAPNDYGGIVDTVSKSRDYDSNILGFLNCDYYSIDTVSPDELLFIKKNHLPFDKKVIIMSATANEWIYSKLYSNRLNFYNLGNVELAGEIAQDTSYTYSKQNLMKTPIMEYAIKQVEERMVVTFQKLTNKFSNAVKDMYFWNLSGYDSLNGENIAIVGTPHVHPSTYLMYAKAINLELKPEDFRMNWQRVEHNGFEFNFYTYENQELRHLQFYFIESELRQALGRARLNWNKDASALVLSNYPLPEARQLNEM